jgi:hypothetical protein
MSNELYARVAWSSRALWKGCWTGLINGLNDNEKWIYLNSISNSRSSSSTSNGSSSNSSSSSSSSSSSLTLEQLEGACYVSTNLRVGQREYCSIETENLRLLYRSVKFFWSHLLCQYRVHYLRCETFQAHTVHCSTQKVRTTKELQLPGAWLILKT